MKAYGLIRQKQISTGTSSIMHEGDITLDKYEDYLMLHYLEKDTNAQVFVTVYKDELKIERKCELHTKLHFVAGQKTKGSIMSEYGLIELEIFTHKYIWNENRVAVVYDLLQGGEIIEGYRIIWDMKEVLS